MTIGKAMDVMMGTEPDAEDEPSTVAEVWAKIEAVVTREELAEALGTIEAFLPGEDDDEELAWRSELVGRLATVRGSLGLLRHARAMTRCGGVRRELATEQDVACSRPTGNAALRDRSPAKSGRPLEVCRISASSVAGFLRKIGGWHPSLPGRSSLPLARRGSDV